MKKVLFIFSILTFLFSQAEITNIQASQRTDGSQIVDITYDLLPDPIFEFFEISVLVSLDGGENYSTMNYVSGDLGEIIEPGIGKVLTWNFGEQFGGTYSDQIKIKIEGTSYALVDNNNNQELPFEMVTVTSGAYTFGENDEIRNIEYDYEIMKYPVTDMDYVLFMMDKLNEVESCVDLTNSDGSPWEEGWDANQCYHFEVNGWCDETECWGDYCNYPSIEGYYAQDACCVCGGGIGGSSYDVDINESSLIGYYPGDANYPAGNYTYIEFSQSKISWNGEIFEVVEGNVNHPVTGVTWFGAWAFATHYGMEIPDQYEWEKAARGNTGYDYPWGNDIANANANYSGFPYIIYGLGTATTPTGTFNGDAYDCTIETENLTSNIFFSEYAEGSSNNKYLEIYNPTETYVSLADYAYPSTSNSPNVPGEYEYWNEFDEGAVVAPGDVYVICHGSSDEFILAECDETHTYLSNGDDGFCLVSGTETNFTILDCVGDWWSDPGYGWTVDGIEDATKDHTLVRRPFAGPNYGQWEYSALIEWDVFSQNTWDYLGFHTVSNDNEEYNACFYGDEFITIDSPSPFEGYDMAGNVWEIVKNDDDSYFIKGGAYNSDTSQLQSWYQESFLGNSYRNDIGFRCIRVINQPSSRNIPKEKLKEYYINKKNNAQKSNLKK